MYVLICSAKDYQLVLYEPGVAIHRSDIMTLPLSHNVHWQHLETELTDLIRKIAYALVQQMAWLDEGLDSCDVDVTIPQAIGTTWYLINEWSLSLPLGLNCRVSSGDDGCFICYVRACIRQMFVEQGCSC